MIWMTTKTKNLYIPARMIFVQMIRVQFKPARSDTITTLTSAFVYKGEGQNNEIQQAPMQGQLRFENVDGGVEAIDTLVPGNRSLRLMVNRNCKINVRVIDRFGNPRARGGDDVEAVVVHTETNERASCKVTDHGDGSYLLDFSCPSAGVWMLRCAYNGRLSNEVHKLVVSHGPLTATDLILDLPQGTQPCGGYAPIRVRIARPEDGRQFSGAEGFQVKLTSPSGVPLAFPSSVKRDRLKPLELYAGLKLAKTGFRSR